MKKNLAIILTGLLLGFSAVILVRLGNPGNMGFCIACFIRDTAGALGLHGAENVRYIRPEIIGLVLGALVAALAGKEFKAKGGSAPFTRFCLGFMVMVGALVFLGCPLRMILRIGGGDLNAVVGLVGFAAGVGAGVIFLNRGFDLKRSYALPKVEGWLFPAVMAALLILAAVAPSFVRASESGPGSLHAPLLIALIIGLVIGFLGQKTRLCMVGGIRDALMFKNFHLLWGFLAVIVAAAVMNLAFGYFKLGFVEQPIAHSDGLWNFLGMSVVGWASVLLGGCPFRQLILSGEGNTDSVVTVLGLFVGAAFCHNFSLASSPAGVTAGGKSAVVICLAVLLLISLFNIRKEAKQS